MEPYNYRITGWTNPGSMLVLDIVGAILLLVVLMYATVRFVRWRRAVNRAIWMNGYIAGYNRADTVGFARGYQQGGNDGYITGHRNGLKDGKREGWTDGHFAGWRDHGIYDLERHANSDWN